MRAKIHSGEPDQNRDWKTRQADTAAREDQNTKKCGRRQNVTGGKRVIFRAETRTSPAQLRFHRRAGPWNRAFDNGAGNPRDRHRQQHGKKNAHPFFAVAPPGGS